MVEMQDLAWEGCVPGRPPKTVVVGGENQVAPPLEPVELQRWGPEESGCPSPLAEGELLLPSL